MWQHLTIINLVLTSFKLLQIVKNSTLKFKNYKHLDVRNVRDTLDVQN